MLLRLIKSGLSLEDTEETEVTEAKVAEGLLRCGLLPTTAQRLAPTLLRFGRGEFPELEGRVSHLLFTAWLIDRGVLTDAPETPETPAVPGMPAPFGATTMAAGPVAARGACEEGKTA